MAALDLFEVSSTQITLASVKGTQTSDYIRSLVAQYFWEWYDLNKEDEITRISLFGGLIKYKILVKHLTPLFIKLFGHR